MNNSLPLKLCQRLKSFDFPQDIFPQFIYVRASEGLGSGYSLEWADDDEQWVPFEWIACPGLVEVLEWLEAEKGYEISCTEFGGWYADCPPYPPKAHIGEPGHPLTPQALIEAILDRMERV